MVSEKLKYLHLRVEWKILCSLIAGSELLRFI
jgi:hypothetical protein